MPRFVLLYHDCPPGYERHSHWDLMLEAGDVLKTWALAELPRDWQSARAQTATMFPNCAALALSNDVSAEQLADHRLAYLTFEGVLSDKRGNVVRVASGTYEEALSTKDRRIVDFAAAPALGEIELRRNEADSTSWRLANCSQSRS